MSEFIDIFVKFSNFMSRSRGGLFCPEGRDFVNNDCPRGRVYVPFESCRWGLFQRGGEGVVLNEVDTCITVLEIFDCNLSLTQETLWAMYLTRLLGALEQ